MAQNNNYKKGAFQIAFGVAAYFLLTSFKANKKVPVLEVGNVADDGFDYQPIWFKDSEYFGQNEIPLIYRKNYTNLVRVLDKIRIKFGSAILITKGFEPSFDAPISNGFQNCTSVQIYPQNKNITFLKTLINDMVNRKEIIIDEHISLSNNQIKISKNA